MHLLLLLFFSTILSTQIKHSNPIQSNKFELISLIVKCNIDILLITEIKINQIFPDSKFLLEGYSEPFSLDRFEHRSSHRKCSVKKSVLRNFAKFTGKHLCQSLFFNNVAGLRPATLLKKETLAQVFSSEFFEISKNTVSQNTSGRLLLCRRSWYSCHHQIQYIIYSCP